MNTEELKQKALKCYGWRSASSAWLHESGDGSAVVGNIDDSHDPAMRNPVAVVDVTHYDGFQDDSIELAQFYAAANPATILALIADFERITKQHGELQSALERMVDLANNDGLWCNYDEVIHAEAVLEQIYKSRQRVEG